MATKSKVEETRPAVKPDGNQAARDAARADRDRDAAAEDRAHRVERRECVVDDGRPHVGRATPGAVICSAHAVSHKPDGTPRGA